MLCGPALGMTVKNTRHRFFLQKVYNIMREIGTLKIKDNTVQSILFYEV